MIRAQVLDSALDIQHRFQSARPFRHVAVDDFLDADACEALLRDFPPFDERKALNEHGEVGRKAVFEGVAGISPFYREFYRYINSAPFLEAMSQLTGIPDLIADETLFGGGTHENLDGQGLDVHVDFNIDERRMLHRRVNLLVYLNKEWEEAWGGSIELHSDPWTPRADQVKSFLPLFNRAVIFETNEYSWHGFRRIELPADRKGLSRKSFSIYLYTKDRPAEEAVAPHTTFYVPGPLPERIAAGATLTEKDAQEIQIAMASRDGLLRMYQKLLVEKEQRLRDFVQVKQQAMKDGHMQDYQVILSSRSWRFIMALHRARYRVKSFARRLGLGRA
ncbi:MAG TPA: 2OG-Fe(II) oxygenase [Usitatibacter sp.]|nr:2OG-Fe(II) oxygenase [Usitatibacter sp.]